MSAPRRRPTTHRKQGPKKRIANSLVTIWMTPEDHEQLRTAAEQAGQGLGPWLRSLGMRAAGDRRTT